MESTHVNAELSQNKDFLEHQSCSSSAIVWIKPEPEDEQELMETGFQEDNLCAQGSSKPGETSITQEESTDTLLDPNVLDTNISLSLPDFLHLRPSLTSKTGKAVGVFTSVRLPDGYGFGPLSDHTKTLNGKGHVLKEQVDVDNYWMKYVRKCLCKAEENLITHVFNGSMYYVTNKVINPDEELLWHSVQEDSEETTIQDTSSKTANSPDTSEEKPYQCQICYATFVIEGGLQKHTLLHVSTNDKPYKCKYSNCHRSFAQPGYLQNHVRTVHSERKNDRKRQTKGEHKCDICDISFTRASTLISHLKTHKETKKYKCSYCGKGYQGYHSLTTHMKIHTRESLFQCPRCQDRFTKSEDLTQHLKQHTESEKVQLKCNICQIEFSNPDHLTSHKCAEIEHKCRDCQQVFSSEHRLSVHYKSKHAKKLVKHVCEECGDSFGNITYLLWHRKNTHRKRKPYKCEDCDKTFAQANGLYKHIQTHTGKKLYTCKYCDKTYVRSQFLAEHIKIHEKEGEFECHHCHETFGLSESLKAHLAEHQDRNESMEKLYMCGYCGSKFAQDAALNVHVRSNHSQEREMTGYQCNQCEEAFTDLKKLLTHLKVIHRQEGMIKCEHCNIDFSSLNALAAHLRIHTGDSSDEKADKPFTCAVCRKMFAFPNELAEHVRRHRQKTPHQCLQCFQVFSCAPELVTHQQEHAKERPFRCKKCDQTFFLAKELIEHFRTH